MGRALKYLFAFLLLFHGVSFAQSTGQFFVSNCTSIASPVANSTFCVQTTTTGGRTAGHQYRWNGSTWDDVTAMSGLAGVPGTDCSNTTTGKVIWNNSTKTFSCATDQTVAGAIGSLNGLTASSQTFANDTNVTITSAGSTHTLGWLGTLSKARQNALTLYSDQANTWTTGTQNMAALAPGGGLVVPSATGYAPTGAGFFGFNSTNSHFVGGNGTVTKTFVFSDEIQPLNANLTAFAGLAGTNNGVPIFSGVASLVIPVLPNCTDSGGNHLNYDTTARAWSCGTSSAGSISGLTTGTIPKALSATSLTNSSISETTGPNIVSINGGLTLGAGPYWIPDPSAIASTDKTWTIQNVSGIPAVATTGGGTITDGHIVKFSVAAGVTSIVDGGTAGTGTWTDTSTNTAQNKTITDTLAGGTGNTLTTPIRASWDGGSLTPDGTNCTDPTRTTIGSGGPTQYTFVCPTPSSAVFDAVLVNLPHALTTFKVILKVNEPTTNGHVFAGTVKAQCRASGAAPSSTWGSTVSISITMTTAGNTYGNTLSSAITPNGSACSAGADLYIRFNGTGSMTDTGTARVVGLYLEQSS